MFVSCILYAVCLDIVSFYFGGLGFGYSGLVSFFFVFCCVVCVSLVCWSFYVCFLRLLGSVAERPNIEIRGRAGAGRHCCASLVAKEGARGRVREQRE